MDHLRLMALEADDLEIISAYCQDAVAQVGDLTFLASEKRFVLAMNRFVWEKAPERRRFFARPADFERRRSALHFDRVLSVRQTGIPAGDPEAVIALLAIRWHAGEAPSGTIELVLAGGAAIRLDVECIEAQLTDLGAAWSTSSRPDHDRD